MGRAAHASAAIPPARAAKAEASDVAVRKASGPCSPKSRIRLTRRGVALRKSALCFADRLEISAAISKTELSILGSVICLASKGALLKVSSATELDSVIWREQIRKIRGRASRATFDKSSTPALKKLTAVSTSP